VDPICFKQAISVGPSTELYALYRKYLYQHPLIKVLASAPSEPCVATILTQTSRKAFHQTDIYQKFYRTLGVEDQLILYLPHPKGVYVVVYSRDTAFSEKEQTIMQLLRPQLQIALKNWQRIRELEQHCRTLMDKPVDCEPSSRQVPDKQRLLDRLTPRQKVVAEQVAQGLENREIAEVLHISPKTVGKHIENIFETLDIHHRAALAAMWCSSTPRNTH
jgi:DNA-binding CsgD family transcriptional regulator